MIRRISKIRTIRQLRRTTELEESKGLEGAVECMQALGRRCIAIARASVIAACTHFGSGGSPMHRSMHAHREGMLTMATHAAYGTSFCTRILMLFTEAHSVYGHSFCIRKLMLSAGTHAVHGKSCSLWKLILPTCDDAAYGNSFYPRTCILPTETHAAN